MDLAALLMLVAILVCVAALLSQRRLRNAFRVVRTLAIPLGVQMTIVGFVKMVSKLDDPLAIGPAGSVAVVTLLQGLAVYAVVRFVQGRVPRDAVQSTARPHLGLAIAIYLGATVAMMVYGETWHQIGAFVYLPAVGVVIVGAPALTLIRRSRSELHWAASLQRYSAVMGSAGVLAGLLLLFETLPDVSQIGPAIALALCSLLYGTMLFIIGAMVGLTLAPEHGDTHQRGFLTTFHSDVPLATIQHGILLHDYRLSDVIGEGGMGRVYRARHIDPAVAESQGEVAIKLLRATLAQNERYRARFTQEARLGIETDHPCLVDTYELVDTEDHLGLVMEYVEGEDFEAYFAHDEHTLSGSLRTFEAIASVLDYLHGQSIIHRDVKPDNIRVRPSGVPVLLDLGIARVSSSVNQLTQTGSTMGTITYMAPEQIETGKVGPAADQYALGMIVYELLTQRLPWDEELTAIQIFTVKQKGKLVPLRELESSVPGPVAAAVHRALALAPEDRFETCAAFVAAIVAGYVDAPTDGPIDEDAPVETRPPLSQDVTRPAVKAQSDD